MIGKIFSSMSLTLSLLLGGGHAAAQLPVDPATLPRQIYSGEQGAFHVQGIAVDLERGHVWFSFTTSLLKTDMAGNLLASVEGMTGHLGCMSVNPEDGRLYASIEYKHDAIGKGILDKLDGRQNDDATGFYRPYISKRP